MLKDEVEQLKDELTKLKASLAPTPHDEAAMRKWQSDMHNLREARMSQASAFSRADIEAFRAACPDDVAKSIALRDARAPLTYSSPGPASATPVSSVPGPVGTGWREATPLGPPPGIDLVDRLLELDSAKQRGQAMIDAAKSKAVTEDKLSE